MAIRTVAKSGGADYMTLTAAAAGATTGDTIQVTEAGVYLEAAAISTAKNLTWVNTSGGVVTVRQPLGAANLSISGGTQDWTGFVFEIRKTTGGTEYNVAVLAGATKFIARSCSFVSDYTTSTVQAIYAAATKPVELHDCTMTGAYAYGIYADGVGGAMVVDGLAISGSLRYLLRASSYSGACCASYDIRKVVGNVTRRVLLNAGAATSFNVTSASLLSTFTVWGLTESTDLGSGVQAVEVGVLQGSGASAFTCTGGVSTGITFRNLWFLDFSGQAVTVNLSALSNLVDYCGRWGCSSFSNSAGSVGTHNVTGDPAFTNQSGHDYTLLATSAGRDAGTTPQVTVDLAGNVIPQGTAPDIGAFEWVPSISPVTYAPEDMPDFTVIATTLTGDCIEGFQPWEMYNASTEPLVTLGQIVVMSLFSDRVAAGDDQLPGGQVNRRGWFGDTATDKIGSRLWLLNGSAVSDDTLDLAKHYVEESLAHMTRDGLATAVEIEMELVTVSETPDLVRLDATITVKMNEVQGVVLRFPDLWGL